MFGASVRDGTMAEILCGGQMFYVSNENRIPFTMDLKGLYTNIPNCDGLFALKHYLNQRQPLPLEDLQNKCYDELN